MTHSLPSCYNYIKALIVPFEIKVMYKSRALKDG